MSDIYFLQTSGSSFEQMADALDIEPNVISFKPKDFPYFRAALVDKHIDEMEA